MKNFLSLSLACLSMYSGFAQIPSQQAPRRICATPVYNESNQAYETWMADVLQRQQQFANAKKTSTVYTIPVIFHIIHSGQAVGTANNISQAQVNSQITVLNESFRKTNTDFSTYVTQSGLSSVSADCEINFCAAVVAPTGSILAEPGIERINATSKGWTAPPYQGMNNTYMENTIKPGSSWDPTKYLNIWIVQFNDGVLGYAQFPTVPSSATPTIGDMTGQGGGANTDGVAFDYRYVGTVGSATSPYNKGRTAVHEIGHWLGLWHIWGDDGGTCSGTDYVADTPNQASENYTCPTAAGSVKTDACAAASPGYNYQNYMDYSDDKCLVMFTAGQKARMQACMQYCTRRTSLATSTVCNTSDITIGVKENESDVSVSVFPNPAHGELFVKVDLTTAQDFTIEVVNTLGQIVKEHNQSLTESTTVKMDLADQSTGVYFVTIKSNSATLTKRIILQ